jgi:hypothetical protein
MRGCITVSTKKEVCQAGTLPIFSLASRHSWFHRTETSALPALPACQGGTMWHLRVHVDKWLHAHGQYCPSDKERRERDKPETLS